MAMIPLVLFMLAAQGCSVQKIFSYSIGTLTASHLFVMLCAKIGILQDELDYRYIGDYAGSFFGGQYIRHNMGFLVHNQVALAFLIVYLLLIVYRQNTLKWYENAVIMVLNFIIFKFFGSRIVFLLTVFACIAYYAVRFLGTVTKNRNTGYRNGISFLAYPFCALLSLIASVTFDPRSSLSRMLDLLFNNRLNLAKAAVDFYGFHILGAGKLAGSYNSTVLANNTVDNGYVLLFIQQGIIAALLIIGLWTYVTYAVQRRGNGFLTLALLILAAENLVNAHLTSYKMLPFFCLLMNLDDPFVAGRVVRRRWKYRIKKRKFKIGGRVIYVPVRSTAGTDHTDQSPPPTVG